MLTDDFAANILSAVEPQYSNSGYDRRDQSCRSRSRRLHRSAGVADRSSERDFGEGGTRVVLTVVLNTHVSWSVDTNSNGERGRNQLCSHGVTFATVECPPFARHRNHRRRFLPLRLRPGAQKTHADSMAGGAERSTHKRQFWALGGAAWSSVMESGQG